jgi:predicted  nucleic acid-binding Zn-ribbon protein
MTSDLHKIPDKTIESRKMKTAYETSNKLTDGELKKNAQSFVDRLRKGYTELDAHRKALKTAKKNKSGVSSQNRKTMCIDLKKEIKATKQAIAQIRDEFQQWMNGLPAMA